ncbi:MAG: acetyl-CoA carboxylase biotin carboxyl carrier protein subunit [Alphaproteobacteria bacterium]|nr:acetyl-CoA carboxylase biotin carboxyl carrier protein subunit [Alphaproteobacteria bacterium]MBT4082897.1 acetyl-CoA carboxylase biotin carboxyl carrier protein subunit [Alphaproteobacteria bacterium]MBT4546599.1 acetyl-CoA carboxylase biotin carboxyl carrier protein subunit [Alphaproteobacteria bacterium]MBT7747447.1 acetyl-CoA carboxylase biotin carboxyl carrier protein subunit [Alphaproteobacteria bacterium]
MAEIEIHSEIAGTVWLVEVVPGTVVAEDDTIIVLESMKMEIPVDAPTGGKVTKILVAKDDVVSENQVVAVMET